MVTCWFKQINDIILYHFRNKYNNFNKVILLAILRLYLRKIIGFDLGV